MSQSDGVYVGGRTVGDDQRLKLALLRCALQDLALDRVPADKSKDKHRFGLPDPMCAILCLQIHLRVLIFVSLSNLKKEPRAIPAQPRTQSWS